MEPAPQGVQLLGGLAPAALLEGVLDTTACAIIGTGPDGLVNVFNRGAECLLGYRATDVLGKARRARFEDPAALTCEPQSGEIGSGPATDAARRVSEYEAMFLRQDGSRVPVMLAVSRLLAPDGTFLGELAVVRDVSSRHAVERALRRNERSLRSLYEATPLSITLSDLATGRLLEANPAFFWLTGYEPEELDALSLRELSADPSPRSDTRLLRDLARRGSFGPVERECLRRDGSRFFALVNGVRSVGADGQGTLWTIAEDITERKGMEAALRRAAQLDPLTGLPNRSYVCERLLLCGRRAERDADYRAAVLYIDVDHFAEINVSLGHEAGDLVLQEIAQRLQGALRRDDTVRRETAETASHFGSDEFLVLLEGIRSARDAAAVAERLMAELRRPFHIRQREFSVSVSIGLVVVDSGHETPEEILRDADLAMSEAKRSGRGRTVGFDAALGERRQRGIALQNDLRRAIPAQQLHLVYQPLMNLATGEVAGCEALVRWEHPDFGPVSPVEFIPIAEETGLIIDLGEWVLQAALTQYSQWRATLGELAPAAISVNVSRAQLILDDLVPKLRRVLEATGVEPWRLHLEITETAVMRDAGGALRTMRALREAGVKLALDDFGTGYSSLASLHELPMDVVKIDRSFVRGLETDRASAALIEAVMSVAGILDLSVVAEGIETPRQLEQLQAMGCDVGQGFIFSKPLKPDDFVEFLRCAAGGEAVASVGFAAADFATMGRPRR